MAETDVEELEGCDLGTLEYWDRTYKEEIRNYKSHGDIGEVWFGEDSGLRVIQWILKSDLFTKSDSIVDLGCGNGMILIELAREGFNNLTGVDFSKTAIELAAEIAKNQSLVISYQVFDILSKTDQTFDNMFSIAHDKGTYDAISLHPYQPKTKRLAYINKVYTILKESGILILTSCNWTEKELKISFQEKFDVLHVIPTPTFQFGGKVGNVVTTIVFKKKLNNKN